MNRRTVFGLLLLLLLIIFLAQNTQDATVKFLFLEESVPQTVAILISTLIGIFFGVFGPKILDFLYESRKERQEKEKLKQEVTAVAKSTAEEVLNEANLTNTDPNK
ncbi:MAG: LapA family protein [Chloroflexi bacterium]|nr:LapA family protein [Chloroflexota bacterium]